MIASLQISNSMKLSPAFLRDYITAVSVRSINLFTEFKKMEQKTAKKRPLRLEK